MIDYGNEAILTQGVILILLDYIAAGHYLAGNYFFLVVLTETNSMGVLEMNLLCFVISIQLTNLHWHIWFQFLGPDNLDNLRKLAEQFQKQQPPAGAQATQEEDDDEVPELVAGETFETAAEDGHTHTS